MKNKLKLSVLDQSPIHDGKNEREGLIDTIKLAQECEKWGYHRYWLAEHHNTPGYASSNPEIMINSVASQTSTIRVGSGGVMLNHYNSFKVAETFNTLEALYENRIDVGIGRASGASYETSRALYTQGRSEYPEKAYELIGYLNQNLPSTHPFSDVPLTPAGISAPPVYLLGSSQGSSELAGILGAGFVLALFIGTHDRNPQIIQEYKRTFQATNVLKEPKAILAVACIVASSKEEAKFIASTHVFWKLQTFTKNYRDPFQNPKDLVETINNLSYEDKQYYVKTMNSMVLGTADECKNEIESLAKEYDVDEVMIVNVSYSFEDRKNSYELLAKAFTLGE